MPEKNKILIADSQYLVIESLLRIVMDMNYNICGVADNRSSLIAMIKVQRPDLLITDVNLIDYSGYDDLIAIKNEYRKDLSIMVLCNQLTAAEACQLIGSGIRNIALKTSTKDEIVHSIEMALKKKQHFSDDILDLIVDLNQRKEQMHDLTRLTSSEKEIVRMIAGGFTTKEIASGKNISIHTVMTHRKNIFRKLDISNISDLTRYAIRTGLIENDEDFII